MVCSYNAIRQRKRMGNTEYKEVYKQKRMNPNEPPEDSNNSESCYIVSKIF